MEKDIRNKVNVAEKAADLYIENPDFTIKFMAETLYVEPSEIYKLFPNKKNILQFYYTAQLYKYSEITSKIENFQYYTLAEKLSNLAYTLTDQLLEKREFVELTFDKYISKCMSETDFEKQLEREIKTFFTKDSAISTTASILLRPWFFKLIRKHYLWLIDYWLKDESKGFENTMALTDKWTSFIQEMFYSSVIDKGFDLAKFAYLQSGINQWFRSDTSNH